MQDDNAPQAKKIVIDEDWKAQAEAEKEALEKQRAGQQAAAPEADAASGAGASGPAADDDPPLPKPTFPLLLNTLAVEAMVALGFVPHPTSSQTKIRLNHARHLIDMLDLLDEKTRGNRTADESDMLEELLHQLRMGFVAAKERQEQAGK